MRLHLTRRETVSDAGNMGSESSDAALKQTRMNKKIFDFLALPQELQDMIYEQYILDVGFVFAINRHTLGPAEPPEYTRRYSLLRNVSTGVRAAYDRHWTKLCRTEDLPVELQLFEWTSKQKSTAGRDTLPLPLLRMKDVKVKLDLRGTVEGRYELRSSAIPAFSQFNHLLWEMQSLKSLIVEPGLGSDDTPRLGNEVGNLMFREILSCAQARNWSRMKSAGSQLRRVQPAAANHLRELQSCTVIVQGSSTKRLCKSLGSDGDERWDGN